MWTDSWTSSAWPRMMRVHARGTRQSAAKELIDRPMRAAEDKSLGELRGKVARLRQELTTTTEAYRTAVASHDSEKSIPLLRFRSQLMRQLLESQCELLLSLRSDVPTSESE